MALKHTDNSQDFHILDEILTLNFLGYSINCHWCINHDYYIPGTDNGINEIYSRHILQLSQCFDKFILLNIVGPMLALFYVVILTWQSWDTAWYSLQIGETSQSAWEEPLWPTKMVVPIGAGLLCFVLLAQLSRGVALLIQRIKKMRE